MSQYDLLVRVLDGLRLEARDSKWATLYAVESSSDNAIWAARSRAFVHLYLKVMYGVRDFSARESYVTDGSGDGGIDGYFIDKDRREVILIQSKFRHTIRNFEEKPIEIAELLSMKIKSILNGEDQDENGVKYNGKIQGLQRRLDEIIDLGRYNYRVVILANVKDFSELELKKIVDGFDVEIFDFSKTYNTLLYPVLKGTYFQAEGVNVSLDLSNKSSGSKIGYYVETDNFDCEITVVFVPTVEIARFMAEFKNSILEFNPRGYLDFEGKPVNDAIKNSITDFEFNYFSLLNNGITIICDESSVNENSGRKNRARLFMSNPQIINGGQTAFTLSRLFEELPSEKHNFFDGKEVLVKVIAIQEKESNAGGVDYKSEKISLIDKISFATNSQTVVTNADRSSNDDDWSAIQSKLFENYGVVLERKRGEFSQAVHDGYLRPNEIVSRNEFLRIALASNGRLSLALRRKQDIKKHPTFDVASDLSLARFVAGLEVFRYFRRRVGSPATHRGYVAILPFVTASLSILGDSDYSPARSDSIAAARFVEQTWSAFMQYAAVRPAQFIQSSYSRTKGFTYSLSLGRSRYGSFATVYQEFLEGVLKLYDWEAA